MTNIQQTSKITNNKNKTNTKHFQLTAEVRIEGWPNFQLNYILTKLYVTVKYKTANVTLADFDADSKASNNY